jgi:cell division protein FtsZ
MFEKVDEATMAVHLQAPDDRELRPRITVFGVGGAGGNAVNNMIQSGLQGVEFVVANTDAQALASTRCPRVVQLGLDATQGLGAGSHPEVGRVAAEEVLDQIRHELSGAHMAFITAGMGGGTGTGAAPVIARIAREMGILTVGVVTKPFHFEGMRRMRIADGGISELQAAVDTLIVIPNQNLFRVANEKTTFADAFNMADQVLYSGVACITDLIVKPGLINLDFADVRSTMRDMGIAMMGTGEASGENRARRAAEAAIANPLLDEVSMKGARGLLISITGGGDLTLFEVDEAASFAREQVDHEANIIVGATFDQSMEGTIRVSVVATGIGPIASDASQMLHDSRSSAARGRPVAVHAAPAPAAFGAPALQTSFTQQAPAPVAVPRPVFQEALSDSLSVAPEAYAYAAPQQHQAPLSVVRDNVVLTSTQPKAAFSGPALMGYEPQPLAPQPVEEPVAPRPFLPPQPERAVVRPTRMPTVEDLPLPAQNQIRAARIENDLSHNSHKQERMTLLQRLATVGFGGKKEDGSDVTVSHMSPQAPAQSATPLGDIHAEYVRRPQVAPVAPRPDTRVAARGLDFDDGVVDDIPAFLRRQS